MSIIDEVKFALDSIMSTFAARIDESGMIAAFPPKAWNFYEWTAGNDGSGPLPKDQNRYDLCLNSMYLYVLPMYESLGGVVDVDKERIVEGLKNVLFDKDKGLYKNTSIDDRFSVIGNSLAILAGIGGKEIAEKIVSERSSITDLTLSMNGYFYDALLSVDENYRDYIIKDIEDKYSYMLSCGATTFWETLDGWHAFSDAGSLCHGWSALPIYYLHILGLEE